MIKNKSKSKLKSLLFGFYYGLPFLLITLFLHANLSKAPPPTPFGSYYEALGVGLGLFIPVAAAGLFLIRIKKREIFLSYFFITLGITIIITLFAALNIHRDYFSILFQLIMNHIIIAVIKSELLGNRHLSRGFSRYFILTVLLILILFSLWVMLMGYTIVVRLEPRWIEATGANLYNCIIIFILFINLIHLRDKMFKHIEVGKNTLIVDGYDITRLISTTNLLILHSIISSDSERITCSAIDALAFPTPGKNMSRKDNPKSSDITGGLKKWSCEECLSNHYKATQCPRYKTIYNGILEIQKTLESFELGTILPPSNRKNILSEGWKLMFFEGVRIKIR